jgi:hypothetical protein
VADPDDGPLEEIFAEVRDRTEGLKLALCPEGSPFEVAIAASADGVPAAELGDVGRVAQLPRGIGVIGCTCSLSPISYWYGSSRNLRARPLSEAQRGVDEPPLHPASEASSGRVVHQNRSQLTLQVAQLFKRIVKRAP